MSLTSVRNWLGVFFLGTTAALGAYIIIFQETRALPIASRDATSAFQIIIPTLVAQLTLAFRWIANPPTNMDDSIELPKWAVVGPPAAVLLIMVVTVILIVVDAGNSLQGGTIFKNAVTFCVTLLGSTTVFLMTRVFSNTERARGRARQEDEQRRQRRTRRSPEDQRSTRSD
jgi:hypothetical protein